MPPKTPKSAYKSYLAAREKQEAKPKRFFGFDARKIARERAKIKVSSEVKAGSKAGAVTLNNLVDFCCTGVTAHAQFRRLDAAEIAKASQKPKLCSQIPP